MTKRAIPRLHLVGPLEGVLQPEDYTRVATQAMQGGVDAAHVRLPGASGGDVLRLCQQLMAEAGRATLFVNDRVDVALLVNSGGIHLGERSFDVAQVRDLVGNDVLVGRSVHDVGGAIRAQADGADFVMAGHVFATESKAGQPGRGIDWLAELADAVTLPVIAIGGINVERVESVIQAGAWGVAVGRQILGAPDPSRAARELCEKIEQR